MKNVNNWIVTLVIIIKETISIINDIIQFKTNIKANSMTLFEYLNHVNWVSITSSGVILFMFIIVNNRYKKLENKLNIKIKLLSAYHDQHQSTVDIHHLALIFTDEELNSKEIGLDKDIIDSIKSVRKEAEKSRKKGWL